MSVVNIGIDNNSPQALDRSYGKYNTGVTTPYGSVAEANGAVNAAFRHKGKTVVIDLGNGPVEYWWKNGTADSDLVPKASISAPIELILTTDGSYTIPQTFMTDVIICIPTVTFDLKIGFTAGAEDLMPAITMQANQANVISLLVPAWGGDQTIYFSGIPATTEFLIYRRTLIP